MSFELLDETDNRSTDVRGVLLAWERLRLRYNMFLVVVLLASGLALLDASYLSSARFWLRVVMLAIFANVFFTAGPLVEVYLRTLLGFRGRWFRPFCFSAGTVLSVLLTLLFVLVRAFPDYD